MKLEAGVRSVGRYEKIEFAIRVDGAVQGNPFDPDEVDLSLEFAGPSGKKIALPAFYCQDYERRKIESRENMKDWLYPVGNPVWRARFAPMETGAWSCRASLKDKSGTAQSSPIAFECVPSQSKGFVRVSARDSRYLEFSEGQPFFPIGECFAFVKDTYREEELFGKLAQAGGNYTRVWAASQDWGMTLEGRKSAWGRSWTRSAPMVPLPGAEGAASGEECVMIAGGDGATVKVSPSHPVALRPNTRYVVSGLARTDRDARLVVEMKGAPMGEPITGDEKWLDFKREFTSAPDRWWLGEMTLRVIGKGAAWLKDLSLKEAAGGPELLWEADVNRPVVGNYNLVDCAMLDKVVDAAERTGVFMQVVILPRDLYKDALKGPGKSPAAPQKARGPRDEVIPTYDKAIRAGRNLMRYAVARWGYSTSIAIWEYFNEMDPNAPTDRFYTELGHYMEQIDPYHHIRTTSTWHPSPRDWKHPQLDTCNLHPYMRPVEKDPWKDEVAFVLEKAKLALESEPRKPILFSEFGLAAEKFGKSPFLEQDKDLAHTHGAIWTSALCGLSGTVMSWWWDDLDKMNVYRHYRPVADFVADIPFTTANLRPFTDISPNAQRRVVGLQGKDCAYLWIANPQTTWYHVGIEKIAPPEVKGASVEIAGLAPGEYRLEWWDTYAGKVTARQELTNNGSTLRLEIPPFTKDIACKITTGKAGE